MDWLFTAGELSGLLLLILVAMRLTHRHAYTANKLVIGAEEHHGLHELFNAWAAFIGILLIAVLCWLLATSVFGEGWQASCLALAIFFLIGLNLLDDECTDSDENPKN